MTTVAAETHDLMSELCRHFSRVSGWKMRFTPVKRAPPAIRRELENRPACCWLSEISDGSRVAGFLHLETSDDWVDQSGTDRVLTSGSLSSPAFDSAEARFVEARALAEVLAKFLGRLAKTTTQLKHRNHDVATLLELGLSAPGEDNLAFGLTQLLQAAAHLTGSWSAAFFLLNPAAERLRLRAVYRLGRDEVPQPFRELRTGAPELAALADQPVILSAAEAGGHALLPSSIKSAMCAAVQSETAPFGVLWVYDRRGKVYSQRDIHVLQSISAQVAAVLERSALLRGSEANDRIHRDLKAASDTQPDSTLRDLPHDSRYELAGRCTSRYELGGDLCEVFALSGDRTAIFVGDASGNSIPAAMIMSAVRGAIRTQAAHAPTMTESGATELVSRLNRALCGITSAHQFMSLCYGIYDAACRRFSYANAGHPVPLLFREHKLEMLESHGLLLGVVPDAQYQTGVVQLSPGDLLVLYSDGITEALSSAHELFKCEGIYATARGLRHESAAKILEAIWNSVEVHQGGTEGDDRTLLVLKVR
jgi:sigma-B regulation protein RsbU (phosphoserine phosphatase)